MREAHAHRVLCDWDRALEAARLATTLAAEAASADLLGEALNAEAAVHQSRGDFELAVPVYERILALRVNHRIRGVALQNLAGIRAMQGEHDAAERFLREAHRCFVDSRYEWGQAHVLNNLGRVALDRRDWDAAQEILAEAVRTARLVDDQELLAIARLNHADALFALGDADRAEMEASAAVGHLTSAGNALRRIEALRLLGDISVGRGAHTLARRFYASALQTATAIGARFETEQLTERIAGLAQE